jgi:hypothetical protein
MSDVAGAVETEVQETGAEPKPAVKAKAKAKEKEPPHYHVNEMKTGKRDPFSAAFNEAQDELRGVEDEDDEVEPEPAPAPKKKPAPKPEKKAEAEEKAPEKKPAPKPEAAEEAEEDDEEEESEAEAPKAEKKIEKPEPVKAEVKEPEPKEKGPLEAKKYWPSRRREAFRFQPRHVQEAWLAEVPKADQRWSEEQKTAFEKLPLEGKELLLERHQEFERGYGEKFEGLAKERKLIEEVQKAVPPQMRTIMEQRGITESQMLAKLAQQQLFAWANPKGYIAKFIQDSKINPADLFPRPAEGEQPTTQHAAPQQDNPAALDIRTHPHFQAMAARVRELEEAQTKAAESDDERFTAEFNGLLSEADGEGNSLYPFIRVLAGPMATIIENDSDRFDGLSIRDRLAAAYYQALEDFPELTAIYMTAPASETKVDEPVVKPVADSSGESERLAKLEKAVTPKSQAPAMASASSASDDPFEKAFQSAKKQLGKR